MVAPSEQFQLNYSLSVRGTAQGFVEFVDVNVGDPLQLANMPLYQIDESVFAEVPEPGLFELLALGRVGLAARRRIHGR